jgi:hypothetical protein
MTAGNLNEKLCAGFIAQKGGKDVIFCLIKDGIYNTSSPKKSTVAAGDVNN